MFVPDLGALSELPPPPEHAWSLVGVFPGELTPGERDAVGWTAMLGSSMDAILDRARMVPGFHHAAVGFLHESVDIAYEPVLPIGVVLYTAADPESLYGLRDGRDDAVFEPIRPEGSELAFPVTLRPGRWRSSGSHAGGRSRPPSVAGGRLACWVTTRGGLCEGWLTAAHAAPVMGTVLDTAGECTDAAVIAGRRPGSIARQRSFRHPAYGIGADLDLGTGVAHATILDVSVDFDIYRSPRFPVRFSLDIAGQPGDSGAYISRHPASEPLGLYLGEFLPSTAQQGQAASGYGLAMYQLEHMMDLEAYP